VLPPSANEPAAAEKTGDAVIARHSAKRYGGGAMPAKGEEREKKGTNFKEQIRNDELWFLQ